MARNNNTLLCLARSFANTDDVTGCFFREENIKHGLVENELCKNYKKRNK